MTATIDQDTLIALLEDGAHSEAELADWLEAAPEVVRFVLRELERGGRVRRAGDRRWQRAATAPPVATAPALDDVDQAIVTFLATPAGTGAIRALIDRSETSTLARLHRLEQLQVIVHHGRGCTAVWSLPWYVPPVKEAPARSRASTGTTAAAPAPARVKTAVPVDAGASWWTQHADPALPRENFTNAARARDAEMSGKSPNWRRPTSPHNGVRPTIVLKELL